MNKHVSLLPIWLDQSASATLDRVKSPGEGKWAWGSADSVGVHNSFGGGGMTGGCNWQCRGRGGGGTSAMTGGALFMADELSPLR